MDGAERCEQEKKLKTPSLSPYCFPALRLRAGTPSCEPLETANPKLVTADNSRDREKLIVFNDTLHLWYAFFIVFVIVGRVSSVGRALDCRAGGCGFDSRGRTNTQGLKITEK